LLQDGHHVATTCRSQAETDALRAALGDLGGNLVAVEADATDEDSVGRATDVARRELGSIEVLVHLVGGWHGGEDVHEHSLDTWKRIMDINLTSAFLWCRAVLPEMLDGGWGRLVLTSSRTAKEGRNGQVAYAVAKEGVATLAEVIADECCGTGVTANTIAPSVLDTPANRQSMPSADFSRWVTPEVAAAMVAFLISEEALTLRGAWLPVFGAV
jgi:NAD(P)-dependent dehydrogenase (short-subunit alcohol dehydrogenase family)